MAHPAVLRPGDHLVSSAWYAADLEQAIGR
jgi:hypothetical protein